LLKTDGLLPRAYGLLPRAYGLPKIHKNDHSMRIIVSSLNSTLYSLAGFLHKILINNREDSRSQIKNGYDVVEKLNDITLIQILNSSHWM